MSLDRESVSESSPFIHASMLLPWIHFSLSFMVIYA